MRKSTSLLTLFGAVAATGLFALSGTAAASAAPAPHAPAAPAAPTDARCPAPSEASYKFTCDTVSPDTIRICAPSKGCAEQSFDKTGILMCQKVQPGVMTPLGQPLIATPDQQADFNLCDTEMGLVRALPPLPLGQFFPAFKG